MTAGPVLRDPVLDAKLHEEGFATAPLLSAQEVRHLRDAYTALAPDGDSGITIDYMRPDRSMMRSLHDLLWPVWERRLPELFVDARPLMSTFVVKHPGEDSEMFLHDDWSWVDVRSDQGFTMWIPLVDVGPDIPNGYCEVVPRSHLLPTGFSGFKSPWAYQPYEHYLRRMLVPVAASAGTGCVWDNKLLHASRPNASADDRPAIATIVVPRSTRPVHAVATGRRHRVLYEVDESYFLNEHPHKEVGRMPAPYRIVGELDQDVVLTPDDVAGVFPGEGLPEPRPVLPPDLQHGLNAASEPFAMLPPTAPRSPHDLHVRAADLAAMAIPPTTVEIRGTTGEVGSMMLRHRFKRTGLAPATVSPWLPFSRLSAVDESLIVLDPLARLRFRLPRRAGLRYELHAVECPTLGSGIRSSHQVSALDLGSRVVLPARVELTAWNDGPGPLVAVLRSVPGFARRVWNAKSARS